MNRFILATTALLLTVVITGCNTMQGLGTDIQQGGQALEKAATPQSQPNNNSQPYKNSQYNNSQPYNN